MPDQGSFPLVGPSFSRRGFLRVAGTGLLATWLRDVASPALLHGAVTNGVSLKGTAKSCILIFLSGGPSQVDTWDLKEGAWTPPELEPTSYNGIRFPQGLMPRTAEQLGRMTIVRSALAWAAVHPLAQSWMQIARNPASTAGSIAPHLGAVVALEAQLGRRPDDILPGFVALSSGTVPCIVPDAGYLPGEYGPFSIVPNATGLGELTHPDGPARLAERMQVLELLDAKRRSGELGRRSMDMDGFYASARRLTESPEANALFSLSPGEHARYGESEFGDALIIARNLVGARRGTRLVQVTMSDWDHHGGLYATQGSSLFTNMQVFDPAFGALLGDLASAQGTQPGRTLLDETLVVVLSEFGRTVGPPNPAGGRDHFLRMSVVFAGGGTRGGRVLGATDATGANAKEYGWSRDRDVRPEDIAATLYSALGIDYTTVRHDDPLKLGYEYVPQSRTGVYGPIDELF
jgi:hypothetical protein